MCPDNHLLHGNTGVHQRHYQSLSEVEMERARERGEDTFRARERERRQSR